jgi:uncharacterized protein involved in response to NO
MLASIRGIKSSQPRFPLFSLGFRPFFFGASVFSALTIGLWMAIYIFQFSLPLKTLSTSQWHAHEMIYGYALAVIAGFLLTAVRNWTRLSTPQGWRLAAMFFLWAAARCLYAFGTHYLLAAAGFDLLFITSLIGAVLLPVVRTRQWRQLAIVAKLLFLGFAHLSFYLGVFGHLAGGVYWGLYGGLYLVISLIMTMGARVIPTFIENGVGYEVELSNPKWINLTSLIIFLFFFIAELFVMRPIVTAAAAALLFMVTTIRLFGWHTPGIWRKPLLWSLYLSFVFIDAGFLLFALSPFVGFSRFLAIHAMTFGGIGLITMGMMSRVALGHSGRSIHYPPKTVAVSFGGLAVGAVVRVLFPLMWPPLYVTWIAISQAIWIASFLIFAALYARIFLTSDATEG